MENDKRKRLFLLSGIGFIIIGLIVTILVVQNTQKQQELRSEAAAATTLTISPSSQAVVKGQQFTVQIMVNPSGGNQVLAVAPHLIFDPNVLTIQSLTASPSFPQIISAEQLGAGTATITVATSSTLNPVTTTAVVATATFLVNNSVANGNSTIQFDNNASFVGVVGGGETNNLVGTTPGIVTVGSGNNCQVTFNLTLPSPTPTRTPTPTPTRTPTPTPTRTPTPTPTNTPIPPTPTRTPSPTPTRTPTPTNTPVPSATPTPTNTPVPTATPTNTPVPTAIPTNTPVPTATPTNTPVPSATPTIPAGPQCIAIKIYLNGVLVTDPSTLQPGQTVVFGVASGPFGERARIFINGTGPFEFSDKNAAGEFIYTYTIPLTATSLSIEAQIYAQDQWL